MQNQKRTIDEVDREVSTLIREGDAAIDKQNQTKRRKRFAPMTQYPSGGGEEVVSGGPPAGYIKRITLKNFMCHEHFELDFGPCLNFIVGSNGSGKSAILTAITIVFGAKAMDTNRGTSLKSLIREGFNTAKITIALANTGLGAFEQGLYGDEIIIERILKRDGQSSQFSIKSENYKEISNKKRDLQRIVDYFSILVLNPMCFLSQDAARSFVTASTPQDKFRHFMRGTLLEEIDLNLKKAETILKSSKSNLDFHGENLKALKEDYEKAKRLFNEIYSTHDWSERKKVLQGKLCWLTYKENEKRLHKLQHRSDEVSQKITSCDEKVEERKLKIKRYKSDQDAAHQEVDDKMNELHECQVKYGENEQELRSFKHKHEVLKEERKKVEKEIASLENSLVSHKQQVQKLEKEIAEALGGNKEQMIIEKNNLDSKINELKKLLPTLEEKIQQYRERESELSHQSNISTQQLQTSLRIKKQELRDYNQRGSNDRYSVFSRNMGKVLSEIRNRHRDFSSPPIGPLGTDVSIKPGYEKWARPIQSIIGHSLAGFIVATSKDGSILRQILRRYPDTKNISITTYKLSYFDYSQGKARTKYPAIVDVLEFSRKEIECLFVDQHRIESIVLVENKDEAYSLLKTHPQNTARVLSLKDNRTGFQSSMAASGGFRLDTIEYQQHLLFSHSSGNDSDLQYLQSVIIEEEAELNRCKEHYNRLLSTSKEERKALENEMRELRGSITKMELQSKQLKVKIEKEVDSGALDAHKAAIDIESSQIAQHRGAIDAINDQIIQLKDEIEPYKESHDAARQALNTVKRELEDLKEVIRIRSQRIEKMTDDINSYRKRKDAYIEENEGLQKNIESFNSVLTSLRADAELHCTEAQAYHSDIPSTEDEVKAEIKIAERHIKHAERRVGMTQEEVAHLLEQSKEKFYDAQEKYAAVDKALWILHESLEKRRMTLMNNIKATCREADSDFRSTIRVRNGFSGALNFDTPGSLIVLVKTTNDETPRNVDTLSGGEKSFSQIALLLSTWSTMRARIIALDEFDVFMDQVNRTIGTKMIMKKLSSNIRTQTIIITPQDIGKIADVSNTGIKIHKMRDPERRNNSNYYTA
ncbi:HCL241Wp [Eremothecium sinecaudum]|uniref:HCL241Wp n=1 Tax=Eremothecium sinecaudum TaxID=45286 RepID=A0A0X8HR51_9SACH|nr:HCL241Wp [Eremothecium sinecaudum]AMD19910.1 HCL241Wp [Eremothecium sinecaudum]